MNPYSPSSTYVIKNLRQLVLGIHNAFVSFEKYQSLNQIFPVSFNPQAHVAIKNILKAWPLKHGSVCAHYLPWNVYLSTDDCIRFFSSFIIKCFFVLNNLEPQGSCSRGKVSDEFLLLKSIFENEEFNVFFWNSIKSNMDDFIFMKSFFKPNTPIILCFADSMLQTRNKSNYELAVFENLIEHFIRNGNGLIVFSQQRLCSSKSLIWHPSYSMDHFKNEIQTNKISIQDAFEPTVFFQKKLSENGLKSFTTGSFDRLLELLALGQDFIFSIESAFQAKYKEGNKEKSAD